MKRALIGIVFASLLLTGCGLHKFDAGDGLVQVEMAKENSKAACYKAQMLAKPDYNKMSDMAIVMIEQQRVTALLVGALTGKSVDPCSAGTNLNDVAIADSAQRNQSLRSLGGGVLNTGKWIAGAWAATEIVDSIGKNAGSNSTVDTGGGDSSISNSRTNTETVSHSTATNAGDGSATTNPAAEGVTIDEPVTVDDTISTEPVTVTED